MSLVGIGKDTFNALAKPKMTAGEAINLSAVIFVLISYLVIPVKAAAFYTAYKTTPCRINRQRNGSFQFGLRSSDRAQVTSLSPTHRRPF